MSQSTDSLAVISPLCRAPSKNAAGFSVALPVLFFVSVTWSTGRPSKLLPTSYSSTISGYRSAQRRSHVYITSTVWYLSKVRRSPATYSTSGCLTLGKKLIPWRSPPTVWKAESRGGRAWAEAIDTAAVRPTKTNASVGRIVGWGEDFGLRILRPQD